MIRGYFAEFGRPIIRSTLSLPRLGLHGEVKFLFDTGADVSLLMPKDGADLSLDVSRLNEGGVSLGVGGSARTFVEPALVGFKGIDGRIYGYQMKLLIAAPQPSTAGLPSLLGRDITDRWAIRYTPRLGVLEADVLDADGVLPSDGAGA